MFYNADIDTPLSIHLNSPTWGTSPLAPLAPNSYLMQLRDHPHWSQMQATAFAWRVVGAAYSVEDSVITYFRAYGMHYEQLPFATFGVNFGGAPPIGGGFKYPPWHRNYYIPVENKFATPNTGGYVVTVLDSEYPSEAFAFGMDKSGQQHRCLVISFRLMPFDAARYPNDTT